MELTQLLVSSLKHFLQIFQNLEFTHTKFLLCLWTSVATET